MSDDPFLITSIGRTATKWLAARLQVDHEPAEFAGRAVSPRQLFMNVAMGVPWPVSPWRMGVMVREPQAQILSVINRMREVDINRLSLFRKHWQGYLVALDKLVLGGARVIRYAEVTTSTVALQRVADYFGTDVEWDGFKERLNVYPSTVKTLPGWANVIHETMLGYYSTWQSFHDSRQKAIDAVTKT